MFIELNPDKAGGLTSVMSQKEFVLVVLANAKHPLSPLQVSHLGKQDHGFSVLQVYANNLLLELVKDGRARKLGRGKYIHADHATIFD